MDGDGLLVFGAGIDLAKVPSLERKRIVAFVNYFALQSVSMLTEFASVCEHRFAEINLRIERARTSLGILEAKLASVPDLVSVTPTPTTTSVNNATPASTGINVTAAPVPPQSTPQTEPAAEQSDVPAETPPPPKETLDPAYQRYIRMAKVGIPMASFRNEMLRTGLDPDLLESFLAGGAPPSIETTTEPAATSPPAAVPPPPPPVSEMAPPIPRPLESQDSDIDSLSSASSFDDDD